MHHVSVYLIYLIIVFVVFCIKSVFSWSRLFKKKEKHEGSYQQKAQNKRANNYKNIKYKQRKEKVAFVMLKGLPVPPN